MSSGVNLIIHFVHNPSNLSCFFILSHKLRCYTVISGPEKSRKNTREKI